MQYAEMWVQDAAAMNSYANSSVAATQMASFTVPPQATNEQGLAAQVAAVDALSLAGAGGPVSWLLQLGADLANAYTTVVPALINALLGPAAASTYSALYSAVKVPLGFTTQFNDIGLLINFPISQFLKFAPHSAALGELPKDALGGGLGSGASHWGRGWLTATTSPTADFGRGVLVGQLSVPPSWATATPAIRTVAAALSAAGPEAIPAAALGEGSLLSSLSVAGMLGSALGAGAPSAMGGTGVRGRLVPLKELKGNTSPEKLKRLVAQISEKPESVQHHRVDQEGLDGLLQQLAKKPGIHAVHLSKGSKPKVILSDAQFG